MKQLTKGILLSKFGAKTYTRGHDYFDQQRVISLEVDTHEQQFAEFFSEVHGSGQRIYKQDITLTIHNNSLRIEGYCSCPMHYNCKHVVAACLEFIDLNQRGKSTADAVSADVCLGWLDQLTQISQPPAQISPGDEFVIYRLDESKISGKLKVNLYCTRLLKKGGLGKARTIHLDSLVNNPYYSYGYSAKYIQSIDNEIGQLLNANHLSWHEILIEDELGFLALDKMLATGRCFWQNQEKSLSIGGSRPLTLKWSPDERGNSRLSVKVDPEGVLVLTQPPFYIDTLQQLAGTVFPCAFTVKQLEKLLDAPIIPNGSPPRIQPKTGEKISGGGIAFTSKSTCQKDQRAKTGTEIGSVLPAK